MNFPTTAFLLRSKHFILGAIILCSGKDCRNISCQTLQTVCYEDGHDCQDFAVMSVFIGNSSSTGSTLIHIDIMITNILHSQKFGVSDCHILHIKPTGWTHIEHKVRRAVQVYKHCHSLVPGSEIILEEYLDACTGTAMPYTQHPILVRMGCLTSTLILLSSRKDSLPTASSHTGFRTPLDMAWPTSPNLKKFINLMSSL